MSQQQGKRNNKGKLKLHLIPEEAEAAMARGFMDGEDKHGPYNYRKGLSYVETTDSLRRHLLDFLNGEDYDKETGLHHTDLIACNAAMLSYMVARRPDMDDRYKHETGCIYNDLTKAEKSSEVEPKTIKEEVKSQAVKKIYHIKREDGEIIKTAGGLVYMDSDGVWELEKAIKQGIVNVEEENGTEIQKNTP